MNSRPIPTRRAMMFIDGENLPIRYEKMLAEGFAPRPQIIFEPGRLLWSRHLVNSWAHVDLVRVSYYTSFVGADDQLTEFQDRISSILWSVNSSFGNVVPSVFKKAKSGEKTKSVDINLTVDVLRHVYGNDIDTIILLSGDGDYLPLIRDVMRNGKRVYVGALSNGLNPAIRRTVDYFRFLDDDFLHQKPAGAG